MVMPLCIVVPFVVVMSVIVAGLTSNRVKPRAFNSVQNKVRAVVGAGCVNLPLFPTQQRSLPGAERRNALEKRVLFQLFGQAHNPLRARAACNRVGLLFVGRFDALQRNADGAAGCFAGLSVRGHGVIIHPHTRVRSSTT